ncbi:threonine-phosphate decarboxylase CobD [Sporosarcina thermotolerans]|uniref:threonine-phosphate decarboxylase n=1 Tax=Sporosarcina thermotolerans TaxID=633404 RepID=A0AAW9A941_9BACL|nr:threonine-phosphate decarboxylase CobD [Sporosarcina thermotolerans]MDW0116425.1 threonine-phosphate decarboxylase CobD [Sporosarcina thermotolerans]WHT48375.1 threonine-phosphate decarboxylase CobD [Sporosarcina thermotolerans]
MQLPEHGANPRHVYEKFGMEAPAEINDFSENCNPAGPPRAVFELWPKLISRLNAYPDPSGEPFLSGAANYHGIPVSSVIAGNGAAELFSLIAERYRGKQAIVVHPTFSEYEATLQAKGVEITRIVASEEDGFKLPVETILNSLSSASVVYLCTPNNPTGILPERADLLSIIHKAGEIGCEVVLDEAFIDFIDESKSFIAQVKDFPHVIIVRSMTKMYAIPGIRLGYAVAHPDVIAKLKSQLPHWNVNGMAAAIGAVCLDQEAYRIAAIGHANEERKKMTEFLKHHGCTVTDSETNFLSFKPPNARKLYTDMLKQGIVLRHSENFRGMDGHYLRIGMKSSEEMEKLRGKLTEWFENERFLE